MQSITETRNATGDTDDYAIDDNTGSVAKSLIIPRAVIADDMKEQQPRTMASRCRRKGLKFYFVVLVMIVGIAAVITYYSPFRRTSKTKWKGSASVERMSGQHGRYDRNGKKLSGIDLEVQRAKGKDARNLANILPLGRVTEKPGRQSGSNRNNPYKQKSGIAKSPNDWNQRQQPKSDVRGQYGQNKELGIGKSITKSSPKPYQKKVSSTTTKSSERRKSTPRSPLIDSWSFGQKQETLDKSNKVLPVTVTRKELMKIYSVGSSTTQKPYYGTTKMPRSSQYGGNGFGQPKSPDIMQNSRYAGEDAKKFPENGKFAQMNDQNGRPVIIDDRKQYGSNQQYGQQSSFGQDKKDIFKQQYGSNEFGQQNNGNGFGQGTGEKFGQQDKAQKIGNQLYDNNGQPINAQQIYGVRNKPDPTPSPPWKFKKEYGKKQENFDQFGQRQENDKMPKIYGQPGFGQQNLEQRQSGQQQRYGDQSNGLKTPKQSQDNFAKFYGSMAKQKDSQIPKPAKEYGGQSSQQAPGGKMQSKKLPPWRAEPGYHERDDEVKSGYKPQDSKFNNGLNNQKQQPFADNQNVEQSKKPKSSYAKFYGGFQNNAPGAVPQQAPPLEERRLNATNRQMAGQNSQQRLPAGYEREQNRPGNENPSTEIKRAQQNIPDRDRNIPKADASVRQAYKPVAQKKYQFNKGSFEEVPRISRTDGLNPLMVKDKDTFNKLNSAISNAVDRLYNKTGNRNITIRFPPTKRSISGKKYTRGQPVKPQQYKSPSNAPNLQRTYTYPFMNPNLGTDERVNDLVARLTVAELIEQSVSSYDKLTPGIERLSIKKFNWITECLHGQANTLGTAFPQAIGLAAAFSESLIYNVSEAISKEVRAEWNDLRQKNDARVYYGITCFSPTVNILRHPLWGRNQETYGEDPFLTSQLAKAYVRGMQGNNGQHMRVAAGCKHFASHSGPETGRRSFDAKVSKEDLQMTYLPAFKSCVEAGSAGLMCSYNRINGVPACANKGLLTDTARKEWGFKGYVVSDSGALDNIHQYHMYTKTPAQSVAAAVSAGCNLELAASREATKKLQEALRSELVTEGMLRSNVKPLFRTRMLLGEFDPPEMDEYRDLIPYDTVQSPAHVELAKIAAKMSFVLMKNINNALPIKDRVKKVAIIGPLSKAKAKLYGIFSPAVNEKAASSPYDGLSKIGESASQAYGCLKSDCTVINEGDVKVAVTGADVVFVCLGTGSEREKGDRDSLSLPGRQMDLLKLAATHANGKPVIALLFNGSPVDMRQAIIDTRVSAILECWFPAQSAGAAIYETLTAKDIDSIPSGRLPMTWPASLKEVPDISDYSMSGRTYRYFQGDALFPFGYGLSYTQFQYLGARVSPKIAGSGQTITVTVSLRNTGSYDAYEVVQLYMSYDEQVRQEHKSVPLRQLVGFKRIRVNVKQVVNVQFQITPKQRTIFSTKNGQDRWIPIHGKFKLFAGGQQPNQKVTAPSNVVQTGFEITAFSSRKLT